MARSAWGAVSAGRSASAASPLASSTALVSSSTNKGTPSVRATICRMTSADSAWLPGTPRTMASACGRVRRVRVSWARRSARRPRRHELRTTGHERQQAHGRHLIEQEAEPLQRRGIGPVQVFPHRQHRLLLGLRPQPGEQHGLGLLLLALGTTGQGWGTDGMGKRQQGSEQRQPLCHGQAHPLQGLLQAGQLCFRRLLLANLYEPLEVLDHRVQRALLMIGRTAEGQAPGPITLHGLLKLPHQARFTNTRLATEQHDLPVPFLHLRPAAAQQPQFLFPPYQRRQAGGDRRLQAARCPADAADLVRCQGLVQSFERASVKRQTGEQALDELVGGGANHHGVGGGQPLEPGGQVGRRA